MARTGMSSTTALALPRSRALAPHRGSVSSIDAYIREINRIPMLTAEDELSLARRFREAEDREVASRLVLSHLRRVAAVARSYLGYGLPHADLIQEGSIGLMKAVRRFDPERGVRLASFALQVLVLQGGGALGAYQAGVYEG